VKVNKIGDRYQVRVEEMLPCPRFQCRHDLVSCATTVWCPDGCFDSNGYYGGVCVPKCVDCVFYPDGCDTWKTWNEKENHCALDPFQEQGS